MENISGWPKLELGFLWWHGNFSDFEKGIEQLYVPYSFH